MKLIDEGTKNLFYNKEELNQGAYLTPVPAELMDILNDAYRQAAGQPLVEAISTGDTWAEERGRTLVVGATERKLADAEAEVQHLTSQLQARGKLATWWSYPLSEEAQAALKSWPYIYIYVGTPSQKLVCRHHIADFRTSMGNQGMVCPWPEYQNPDSVDKTRAGSQQSEVFKTWFLVDRVDWLPSAIPLDHLVTTEGLPAAAQRIRNSFGLWCLKALVSPDKSRNFWIFQSNPDVWDLRAGVRSLTEVYWLASRYASQGRQVLGRDLRGDAVDGDGVIELEAEVGEGDQENRDVIS